MQLSFFEIVIVIFISQGLFLIIALEFTARKNIKANKILQFLIAFYGCILLERLLIFHLNRIILLKYGYVTEVFYFLIGPYLYAYLQNFLFHKTNISKNTIKHFIPSLIVLIFSIVHIILYDIVKNNPNYYRVVGFCLEFGAVITILFYLYKSTLLFTVFEQKEKLELSNIQNIIKYLKIIILNLFLFVILWLFSIIDRYFINTLEFKLLFDISLLFFGFQFYIIAFYSLKQPEIFKVQISNNTSSLVKKQNRLNKKEVIELQRKLDTYLLSQKAYLRPELSLSILANEINSTSNNLSWLLNNIYEKSFYKFINEYRINDFIERVKKNEHKELTLISIGLSVGFNSKSTFYKAFKEIKKMTPSEFIKKSINNKP